MTAWEWVMFGYSWVAVGYAGFSMGVQRERRRNRVANRHG